MEPKTHRHLIALIGDPVSHSLSPVIHNAALESVGLRFKYAAIRVAPSDLAETVERLRTGKYLGANVTIPHKENVVQMLDRLTTAATRLNAVNTIRVIENTDSDTIILHGDNTDVFGFALPLSGYANQILGLSCLVWGAGGAARAVVYALLNQFHAGKVSLVSRSPERAERIQADLDPGGLRVSIIPWPAGRDAVREAALLVNATPLGTTPNTNTTPCPDPSLFTNEKIVYDLVYNPQKTRLLRDAQERGAITIGGLEMLIGQASQSFLAWTGTPMPVDVVRRTLSRHLKNHP